MPVGDARRSLRSSVAGVGVLLVLVATGCSGSAPEVPVGPDGEPDPVLVLGRDVYGRKCASCHGSEGQGGRGKKLSDGRAEAAYPDIDDMVDVVTNGKGSGMPAFGDDLDPDEIEAVVRYVREVL